ncbi:MFS transporter [Chloroflexota bacterium]
MKFSSLNKDNSHTPDNTPPLHKAGGLFYGWILVIALTLSMTAVYGASFSFGVFLKPLAEGFDWSRTATSGAFAASLWIGGLLSVPIGALTDKYGPRIIVAIGGLLGGLGYLLIANMHTLWHLYLGFFAISMNMACTWTPVIATVSRWFSKKRVLAVGIVTAGVGLGQMFMPPLATYLITANGWRTAYTIIAVIIWVIVIPSAIPARHSPRDMGLLPDGTSWGSGTTMSNDEETRATDTGEWSSPEALRQPAFWLLVIISVVLATTLFMANIHLVAYATDVGIAPTSAALVMTFMGGANILSKVVAGAAAAKFGSKFTLLFFLALEIIALFSLSVTTDLWMLFAVATLFGFGFGGAAPPLITMVAEFFGLRSIGVIMGLTGVGWAAGCALGTFLGDYIFDISGSYVIAFLIGGAIAVIAAILLLFLRAPSNRKI